MRVRVPAERADEGVLQLVGPNFVGGAAIAFERTAADH